MGYYIQTPNTSFSIRTSDLPRFFDLVANLMSDKNIEENGNGGATIGGVKKESWYSWVNTEDVRKAVADRDIIRIFECWGYDLEFCYTSGGERDLNNPAVNTEFTHYYLDIRGGEAKIGDEEKFFAAIAPVVIHGCYIDVRGEDGAEWRWLWENGKFYVQDVLNKSVEYGEREEIFFEDANKIRSIK